MAYEAKIPLTPITKILLACVISGGVVMLGLAIKYDARPPSGEVIIHYRVHVLRTLDSYNYLLRDDESKYPYHAHFCANLEPMFDGRMILEILKYEDRGDCWDIRNTHPAYLIRRDSKTGKPFLEEPYVEVER